MTTCFILFQITNIFAQDSISVKKKFEVKTSYILQRPFYSVNSPIDLFLFRRDYRLRSALSFSVRYFPFERWYAEYQLSYSQEGAGYNEQFTNANYEKNSLFLGYSSKYKHRIIFEIYTGFEMNVFLNAKFKNKKSQEKENVSSYFNRLNYSIPLGVGFKTKISNKLYLSFSTFVSMGISNSVNKDYLKAYQVIFPSMKIGISKFIN